MKHLSRGLVAGAAGLLLSFGLATPAGAAPAACEIRVSDAGVITEGDSGTTSGAFVVSATATNGSDPCNGVVVNYAFGGTATNGTDYTGANGSLTFGTAKRNVVQTQQVPFSVVGDTADEVDETITLTLTTSSGATLVDNSGTATITDDDDASPPPAGIGDGGALTINPTSGPAGTDITVNGTACEDDTASVVLGSSDGGSGGPVESTRQNATVGSDGSFTATINVPLDSDPDRIYSVEATCGNESYEGKAFDVTPPASTTTDTNSDETGPTGDNGYRMVAADGGIFTFGEREFWGSTGSMVLNKPIVGGATDTSDYEGYWIVASDGGVFAFSAEFHGSLADRNITSPAVEIEPTPSGKGYWIVQADGTVTAFGDAKHVGDFKGKPLNKPVIGMAVTPTGGGY